MQPDLKEIADGIAQKINEFVATVDWAELGQTIHDGIKAALDFLRTILDNLDWDSIGSAIVDFLENLDWPSLLAEWQGIVGKAIGGALQGVDLTDAIGLGANLVGGLIKGWLNKWNESGGIGGWLKRKFLSPFLSSFQSFFGIASPSKVMAEQGEYLVEGLKNGIKETWDGILDIFSTGVWPRATIRRAELRSRVRRPRGSAGRRVYEQHDDLQALWASGKLEFAFRLLLLPGVREYVYACENCRDLRIGPVYKQSRGACYSSPAFSLFCVHQQDHPDLLQEHVQVCPAPQQVQQQRTGAAKVPAMLQLCVRPWVYPQQLRYLLLRQAQGFSGAKEISGQEYA